MKPVITTAVNDTIGTVTLHRPEVHNALNLFMIRELTEVFTRWGKQSELRVLLLRAAGINFSAGADLNWMREGLSQSASQLKAESMELADLFHSIASAPQVVVCAVKGKVMGGANGLVAASDLVIAGEDATFAFSEVKLGLVPATISPYVLRKVGYAKSLDWMITGRLFTATEAQEAGMVQYLTGKEELEAETERMVNGLLENGPEAMKGVKHMLNDRDLTPFDQSSREHSAALIARYRTSNEGQEGMNAFFEKRKPGWHAGH